MTLYSVPTTLGEQRVSNLRFGFFRSVKLTLLPREHGRGTTGQNYTPQKPELCTPANIGESPTLLKVGQQFLGDITFLFIAKHYHDTGYAG